MKNPSKKNIIINSGKNNDKIIVAFRLTNLLLLYLKLLNFTNVTKAKIINKAAIISFSINLY